MKTWKQITDDPFILETVTGYKIPFTRKVVQQVIPTEPSFSKNEYQAYADAVRELLKKGAIARCIPEKGQFLSSYFLRQKPNGKKRFILNLKSLNKFIDAPHIKIEDVKTALKLMAKDCFMASMDLKDAYFLIPIHQKYKKFLKFVFNGKLYEFNVVPFGISSAPYLFTKLLKSVAQYLRSRGFISVFYLDEFC